MASRKYNVYVAAETGFFKGVNTIKKTFCNLNTLESLNRDQEITAQCWGNSNETEVLLGLRSQVVNVYNTERKCFTRSIDVITGEGPLKGLATVNGNLITCVESGLIKVWDNSKKNQIEIDAGENLCKMRQNPQKTNLIATGGRENDLKIWDLQNPVEPIFKAKNVRNDFLDLRVPVWVLDMHFIPNSEKIVTCTGYHHIRVYDPTIAQRRPVINMEFDKFPITALCLTHSEYQVVVGNSRGRMGLIDIRKKGLVHIYKGFAGSIRCVQCHPKLPLVASCGLDRFLRVHDLNTNQLLVKVYLKSRLNSLLICNNYELDDKEPEIEDMEVADDDDDNIELNYNSVEDNYQYQKDTD